MVNQDCIPLEKADEWTGALEGLRHAFAHTWDNCYAMHLTTGWRTFLYTFEEGDTRVVCPFAERAFGGYTDIVTPMGFSGFTGNACSIRLASHWKQFMESRGYVCGYIGQNPIFENGVYPERSELIEYNSIYMLELARGLDYLVANLDNNRKKQLRKWDVVYEDFIFDRKSLKDFFLKTYPEFIRKVNASASCFYTRETLEYLCDLDNILMIGAGKEGEVKCVFLFAYTPYAGESFLTASIDGGRHYSFALTWYAVKELISLQVPVLNLGGGAREDDGIARFKQRFGGRRVPLACMKQIYRHDMYEQLCAEAGVNPDDRTGYFPPFMKSPGAG